MIKTRYVLAGAVILTVTGLITTSEFLIGAGVLGGSFITIANLVLGHFGKSGPKGADEVGGATEQTLNPNLANKGTTPPEDND